MRNFLIAILVFISCFDFTCKGQNLIQDSDSLKYLWINDADTLYQVSIGYYAPRKKQERDRLFYLNGNLFDSTGVNFKFLPQRFENKYRGYKVSSIDYIYKIYSFEIGKPFNLIKETPEYVPLSYHYGSDPNSNRIIYSINASGKLEPFASLESYLDYLEAYRSSEEIWKIQELSKEKILSETCAWGGGCTLYRYFIIEKNSVKEIDFDQLRQPYKNQFEKQYEDFRVNFYFSHYDYDFLMAGVDYGNLPENTDLIFSKDLEDTTHIIKKHLPFEIIGENVQEGKNHFFYLRSQLDNGEKVIVSYKVDKTFENIAHQIFKDHLIAKDRLNSFNADQLGILKNLIFARHNCSFSTDFYQAYFNLFDFYNDEKMRSSRTKDMNGLLTEADLDNLELINKALKKYD